MNICLTIFALLSLCASGLAQAQLDDPSGGKRIQPVKKNYTPVLPLLVWFDCYLDTGLDCVQLEKSFFEKDTMARLAPSEKGADVIIKLRDWQIPPLEQYEAEFIDNSGKVTTFKIGKEALQIRATLTPIGKIENIVPHLLQGLLVHHEVADSQYNQVGQLTVTFNPKTGAVADVSKKPPPWYVQASGGGFGVYQNPSVNILASASVTAGYTQASPTTQGWLVEYGLVTKYNFVTTTVQIGNNTATETASNFAYSNGLIVAKSVAKHWAVATFIRENRDPSSNYATQTQVHGGIEYELLPYLTSNDNAFTVNYLIGGNYQTYIFPNAAGQLRQAIATHALSVYYVYHTHAFDISGSVGLTSLVTDFTKWGVGGQLMTRLYITRTLTVDISANFGYKQNLVNAPANPNESYQLLTLMGVGQGADVSTITGRVMLTYTFGGTLTRQKDTRWQFTSDEVPNNF